VDRVVADKAQTYCPRLERLVPWVLKNRSCLDHYELLDEITQARDVPFQAQPSGGVTPFETV
jgi:hypothetical protein